MMEDRQTECLSLCVSPQICLKAKRVDCWHERLDYVQRRTRYWCILGHMTSVHTQTHTQTHTWLCTAENPALVHPGSHDLYTHTQTHTWSCTTAHQHNIGASWVTWPLHTHTHRHTVIKVTDFHEVQSWTTDVPGTASDLNLSYSWTKMSNALLLKPSGNACTGRQTPE